MPMAPWNSEAAAKAKKLAGRSLYTLGSGLCKAGGAVAKAAVSSYQTLTADHSDKEKVCFCRITELEWSDQVGEHRLPVCLVGYDTGFQIWSLEGKDPVELVSIRRDGAVRWLEPVPSPRLEDPPDGPLAGTRPLVAVVPSPGGSSAGGGNAGHRVQLYSLRTQGYARSLAFGSEVLGVLCSSRLLVVALRGQLQAFDAVSLEHTFSCLTYCPPPNRQPAPAAAGQQQGAHGGQGEGQEGGGVLLAAAPCALGPRWLAYAADQAVQASCSQAKAQRLPLHRRDSVSSSMSSHLGSGALPASRASSGLEPAGSVGSGGSSGGGLTGAAVTEVAKEYAVKSGQQLAAGLAAAGSASYKYLSSQYRHWRSGAQQGAVAAQGDASVGGTVMVRDVVTRQVVTHFRAHASALAALAFSPDGTLLATASTAGHNVNVFRIVPPPPGPAGAAVGLEGLEAAGLGGQGAAGYAMHLLRLHRGMTATTIQAISFAPDASWAAVTSGRGTHHVFHLAGPGSPLAACAVPAALGNLPLPPQLPIVASVGPAGLEAVLQEGVAGQPLRLVAAGRAAGGRPGLLSSGITGAATQAALSVYGQQTEVVPAAAAFMPTKPSSPRAVLASPHLVGPEAPSGNSSALSLVVLSCEGLLTRHMLQTPGTADAAPRMGQHYSAAGGGLRSDAPAGDTRPVAALQQEARWDICRQYGWQEREEIPANFLPLLGHAQAPVDVLSSTGAVLGAGGNNAPGYVEGQGVAVADPTWLSQAEVAPPFDPAMGPPLWMDPQFRFVGVPDLQVTQAPQHQQSPWAHNSLGGSNPGPGSFGRSPSVGMGPSLLQCMPGGLLGAVGIPEHVRPPSSLSSASSGAAGMHWQGH